VLCPQQSCVLPQAHIRIWQDRKRSGVVFPACQVDLAVEVAVGPTHDSRLVADWTQIVPVTALDEHPSERQWLDAAHALGAPRLFLFGHVEQEHGDITNAVGRLRILLESAAVVRVPSRSVKDAARRGVVVFVVPCALGHRSGARVLLDGKGLAKISDAFGLVVDPDVYLVPCAPGSRVFPPSVREDDRHEIPDHLLGLAAVRFVIASCGDQDADVGEALEQAHDRDERRWIACERSVVVEGEDHGCSVGAEPHEVENAITTIVMSGMMAAIFLRMGTVGIWCCAVVSGP